MRNSPCFNPSFARPGPIRLVTVLAFGFMATVPSSASAQATTPEARLEGWNQHRLMEQRSPFGTLDWVSLGPKQAGARIESIAVPPGNHGTILVGVGSGNLWRTENNGVSWTPIFENESAFSIGDVAIAPSDPEVLWVGTGETQPRHSGYSFSGTGVFRSLDGGETWQHRGLADTHHIGEVLVHPRDPDLVYVAAIGHFWTPNSERGVFRTRDGGESWERVLYLDDYTGAVELAMDPSNPERVFAAMWEGMSGRPTTSGPNSGIFRTEDGGESWERLTEGLPDGPLGRIGLDIAPSDSRVVYAFTDDWNPSDAEDREIVGGQVYRSDDSGASWRRVNEDDTYSVFGIYGWKFTDIRVSPENEDELYILGNRAFFSVDGGRTFSRIGEDIVRMHDTRGVIMHLDHHDIWIDPLNPDRILLGNDGGLFQSWDRGASWLHLNTIPAAEFYSISVDDALPFTIYGGTQDNAALYGPSEPSRSDPGDDPWENVYLDQWTGGDSFDTYVDPTDPRFVYYEHQHAGMRRMDITGESVLTGGPSSRSIRPRAPEGDPPWRFGWYTPFVLSHFDPSTLLAGGNHLIRSTNRGEDWEAISPDLSDPAGGERAVVPFGTITIISESRLEEGTIFVGTEGGTVWRTFDGGADWTRVDDGLPEKWVSRVVVSEHTPGLVYLSMTGFREDDYASYLYRSTDYGDRWEPISSNLPLESINVVAEDPDFPEVIYVGTDLGVYVSFDRGGEWFSLSGGLPSTPVHDLVVHPRDRKLVLGTHGRSVFMLDLAPVTEFAEQGGTQR